MGREYLHFRPILFYGSRRTALDLSYSVISFQESSFTKLYKIFLYICSVLAINFVILDSYEMLFM